MLTYKESVITLTKGDTATIQLVIYNPDGSIYELQSGDTAVFSLRTKPERNKFVFQKTFSNKKITIDHKDTLYLQAAKYFYDTVLTTADGKTETVNNGTFYLTDM